MASVAHELRRTGFAATERRDAWWVAPVAQGPLLAVLVAYANWAAFQGTHYQVGGYLSPLYSPLIAPGWFPFSPALLILIPPVLFRHTCSPRPARLRRRRAARHGLPRRDRLPADPPEPPPLSLLHHGGVPRVPLARRVERDPLRGLVRDRRRDARDPHP